MKTKVMSILLLFVMLITMAFTQVQVFATETPIENTESTIDPSGGLPNVTLDDAQAKVEDKAYSFVSLLQTIGKPVCVIGFIIAILSAVFGALGKKGAGNGLIAAFIAAIAYICINYAQEIILFIQSYVLS